MDGDTTVTTTLSAFTTAEKDRAHALLGLTVAQMMGRKMEEGDWSHIYCVAKGIPERGWSNLNIDVMHQNLGVEHKMMCVQSNRTIESYCGTTLMHPSATRSIRIDSTDADPVEVMRDVLSQYADLIALRRRKVEESSGTGQPADMRTGWLLWQDSLRQFLYFEEPMLPPDPTLFTAEWHETVTRGARKPSVSLWIYEVSTGMKRYSVTTTAGIKIQPYFDVPPPTAPNVYIWTVIGEHINGDVRVWLTRRTSQALKAEIGSLEPTALEAAIRSIVSKKASLGELANQTTDDPLGEVVAVQVPTRAYASLATIFDGKNDEHLFLSLLEALVGSI